MDDEREPFVGALEPAGDYDLIRFDSLDLSGQDAREARLTECELVACTLDETRLDDAHLVETTLAGVHATTVHARGSVWRAVTLTECRLGALLATGARADDVTIR
ncbi:MAG TPA: pentapeptide repeat-containing protein, partial [Actinotalea sp.]|nr:pentapeptide repeat-containing protein [Actinotalea sp.]